MPGVTHAAVAAVTATRTTQRRSWWRPAICWTCPQSMWTGGSEVGTSRVQRRRCSSAWPRAGRARVVHWPSEGRQQPFRGVVGSGVPSAGEVRSGVADAVGAALRFFPVFLAPMSRTPWQRSTDSAGRRALTGQPDQDRRQRPGEVGACCTTLPLRHHGLSGTPWQGLAIVSCASGCGPGPL
jgi:hypothetical protein